jgi:DNA gyrase subunit B
MYRFFRPLVDGGFVYIAQPPLFKIKKGKEIFYAYSDEERAKIIGKEGPSIDDIEVLDEANQSTSEAGEVEVEEEDDEAEDKPGRKQKITVQRYKGLGEMNAEELKETTMDVTKRVLKQVRIDDAAEADKVFDILMGTDVPSRKSFIQSNAQRANIDI